MELSPPPVDTESLPRVCGAVACYKDVAKGQRYCDACIERKDALLLADLKKFSGYVYFIQGEFGGPIKIGYTANYTVGRIKALQTGSPYDFKVIGRLSGGRWLEKKLHSLLRCYRVKREWFEPNSVIYALAAGRNNARNSDDTGYMKAALDEHEFKIWQKAMDGLMWKYSELEEDD